MISSSSPPPPSFLLNFLLGGVSAAISKTAIAPLERLKLVLQTHPSSLPSSSPSPPSSFHSPSPPSSSSLHSPPSSASSSSLRPPSSLPAPPSLHPPSSPLSLLWMLLKNEGVLPLWRGNWCNIIRYFPTQALNFAFKDLFNSWLCKYNPETQIFKYFLGNLVAGGLAGGMSLSIVYPLDLARTKLASQIGKNVKMNGMGEVLRKVKKEEGVRGLYKGYCISLIGVVIYRAFYFGGWDTLKKIVFKEKKNTNFWLKFSCAQTCTAFAGILSYPLDTVKRRMMVQDGGRKDLRRYGGSVDCIIRIWKKEGWKAFWKGGLTNIWRGVGASLVLVLYDEVHIYLANQKNVEY